MAALGTALIAALLSSGCVAEAPSTGAAAPTLPASVVTSAPASPSTATPSATPSRAPSAAPALQLHSVSNFRDVAGDGLALAGGGRMATGVVYRSAELNPLSTADASRLSRAGVRLVLDLRSPAVARRVPDPTIPGAEEKVLDVFAGTNTSAAGIRTVAAAKAHMRSMNTDFVTKSAQRQRIGRALALIAAAQSPVLVHCTEGKDRTGWVSALLQLVAGASHDEVIAEYLKSNAYRATVIASAYRTTLASKGRTAALVQRAQLKLEADYLDAGLTAMTSRYGTLDGYLTDGLGLSQDTVAKLRARLVAR